MSTPNISNVNFQFHLPPNLQLLKILPPTNTQVDRVTFQVFDSIGNLLQKEDRVDVGGGFCLTINLNQIPLGASVVFIGSQQVNGNYVPVANYAINQNADQMLPTMHSVQLSVPAGC